TALALPPGGKWKLRARRWLISMGKLSRRGSADFEGRSAGATSLPLTSTPGRYSALGTPEAAPGSVAQICEDITSPPFGAAATPPGGGAGASAARVYVEKIASPRIAMSESRMAKD